jgi:hypothetical protein
MMLVIWVCLMLHMHIGCHEGITSTKSGLCDRFVGSSQTTQNYHPYKMWLKILPNLTAHHDMRRLMLLCPTKTTRAANDNRENNYFPVVAIKQRL